MRKNLNESMRMFPISWFKVWCQFVGCMVFGYFGEGRLCIFVCVKVYILWCGLEEVCLVQEVGVGKIIPWLVHSFGGECGHVSSLSIVYLGFHVVDLNGSFCVC